MIDSNSVSVPARKGTSPPMSKNRKKNTPRPRGGGVPGGRSFPWSISIAVLIIAGLVSVIAYNMVPKAIERTEAQKSAPSADNPDPSLSIEGVTERSEEHTSELQALMRTSYAVFCLNKTDPSGDTTGSDSSPPLPQSKK